MLLFVEGRSIQVRRDRDAASIINIDGDKHTLEAYRAEDRYRLRLIVIRDGKGNEACEPPDQLCHLHGDMRDALPANGAMLS